MHPPEIYLYARSWIPSVMALLQQDLPAGNLLSHFAQRPQYQTTLQIYISYTRAAVRPPQRSLSVPWTMIKAEAHN